MIPNPSVSPELRISPAVEKGSSTKISPFIAGAGIGPVGQALAASQTIQNTNLGMTIVGGGGGGKQLLDLNPAANNPRNLNV